MTWPKVFDGVGAVVVRCDIDPEQLVEKIERHSGVGTLSWIAPKVNGPDIIINGDEPQTRAAIGHCVQVWRALGLSVGHWIYNNGPPAADVAAFALPWLPPPDLRVYDVEKEYKSDETWEDPPGTVHHGQYAWAQELVALTPADWIIGVTSYGGYKTSINFGAFARAGWSLLAQEYDAFHDGDELTYLTEHGGVYESAGVHRLVRRLKLSPGESVYRPEGIDG